MAGKRWLTEIDRRGWLRSGGLQLVLWGCFGAFTLVLFLIGAILAGPGACSTRVGRPIAPSKPPLQQP